MSLNSLPVAVLDTILGRLDILFLTGAAGDLNSARHAARQMLSSYLPETEDELRLAAEIVGFSFHALEALGQAAGPDMPLTRILRLRGSAVSLSRESHKAQRRLDQLQNARRTGAPAKTETAPPLIPAAVEFDVPSRLSAQASNGHPSTTCGGRWPGLSPGHDGNGESREPLAKLHWERAGFSHRACNLG
jgi:hypothetical protein